MLIDRVNRSLKIDITTAIATTPMCSAVEYEDVIQEKVTPQEYLNAALIAGAGFICPAPANGNTARNIKAFNIVNSDTVTHDIAVYILDDVTKVYLKFQTAMPVKSSLHYSVFHGWSLITA